MFKAYPMYFEDEVFRLQELDQTFMQFGKDYSITEWAFGSLISSDIINKCGYFETNPHNLFCVHHFTEVTNDALANGNCETFSTHIKEGYMLTPAACLHVYPMLSQKEKYNELITTVQKVYRNENIETEDDTHLLEFWVREFVVVGSEEFVRFVLNDFEKKSLTYAKSLFGAARLQVATDFFYPSHKNDIKKLYQLQNHTKTELQVEINNQFVALSSFNYHGTHFSKAFGFDKQGTVVTGCIGFGLNRWLAQYHQR